MSRWSSRLAAGLRARGVGFGDVVALLSYNSSEFLATIFAANHLGAIAMPINWRLAAPELRYLLEHSQAKVLVCDGALIDLANDATKDLPDGLSRVAVSAAAIDGWERLVDLETTPIPDRVRCRGGRRSPTDVHVGNDGAPQGRDDHACQPGVEELCPHHRVRLHVRRRRSRVRTALSRRRARSDHHHHDRRRGDNDHPPRLRRRRRGRRDRAVEGHRGVDGAGDGPRRARSSRHRGSRSVVGAGDHRRRREAADPVHRSAAPDVPIGLVRRRLRSDRDGVRRHVPRP